MHINIKIVHEKNNQYQSKKKETENFVLADMRTLTEETVLQKALRTVPVIRDQSMAMCNFGQRVRHKMT